MVQRERRIEEIAYLLWEQEGRPDGQAERFWHAAEAQFEAEVARAELSAAVAEAPSEGAALKKRAPAKANAGGEEHEKAVRTAKPKAAKAPAAPRPSRKPWKRLRSPSKPGQRTHGQAGRQALDDHQEQAYRLTRDSVGDFAAQTGLFCSAAVTGVETRARRRGAFLRLSCAPATTCFRSARVGATTAFAAASVLASASRRRALHRRRHEP